MEPKENVQTWGGDNDCPNIVLLEINKAVSWEVLGMSMDEEEQKEKVSGSNSSPQITACRPSFLQGLEQVSTLQVLHRGGGTGACIWRWLWFYAGGIRLRCGRILLHSWWTFPPKSQGLRGAASAS